MDIARNLDIAPEMATWEAAALSDSANVDALPDLASSSITANSSPIPTSSDPSSAETSQSILGETTPIPVVGAGDSNAVRALYDPDDLTGTLTGINKSAGYPKPINTFNIRRGSAEASVAAATPGEDSASEDEPPLLIDSAGILATTQACGSQASSKILSNSLLYDLAYYLQR